MQTSESINELATALSKAQGEMTGAKRGANNSFFKSKYSDLASIIEAISEPFNSNDLSFIQSPGISENMVTVTTRIMHSSGQWIEGRIQLPTGKQDAQGFGSAITYAKRYALQGMAGVPSVDDDGQAAVTQHRPPQAKPIVPQRDINIMEIERLHNAKGKPLDGMFIYASQQIGETVTDFEKLDDAMIENLLEITKRS